MFIKYYLLDVIASGFGGCKKKNYSKTQIIDMDFQQEENTNGTRWSWNVLPSTKLEASRVIVPVGCLYTPLKDIPNMPTLPYEPIVCRSCRSILNPFWFDKF